MTNQDVKKIKICIDYQKKRIDYRRSINKLNEIDKHILSLLKNTMLFGSLHPSSFFAFVFTFHQIKLSVLFTHSLKVFLKSFIHTNSFWGLYVGCFE